MKSSVRYVVAVLIVASLAPLARAAETPSKETNKTLNVLFIGNSYTARHNLSQIVKTLAEEGNPGLKFDVTTVIYGGRTPKDHWRLGSQNMVKLWRLTKDEEQATIDDLKAQLNRDPDDKYARNAIERHNEMLELFGKPQKKWDIVVLQSYRDDMEGDKSAYAEFVPKFAELIHEQGARVVLYETTPTTHNAEPLKETPDRGPIVEKEKSIARLAKKVDATVVPMSIVAQLLHERRPDLTLRYVNDGHPNQVMAYLTACAFYAALFEKTPEGLKLDRVVENKTRDKQHPDQDPDGGPLTRVLSAKDRADLQRCAWDGVQEFRRIDK